MPRPLRSTRAGKFGLQFQAMLRIFVRHPLKDSKIVARHLLGIVALLTAAALCISAQAAGAERAQADAKQSAPRFIIIPVYYVTDREMKGDSFGPHRKYIVDCLHDMYYGTAYVAVPNDEKKIPDAAFEKLGWKGADRSPGYISRKDRIEDARPEAEKDTFVKRLDAAIDKAGNHHVALFAHGGADPFEDAASDAAEIAYYMECPIVLYSWPSVGKLNRYRVDEGNVEWSQRHFNTFIWDLEKLAEKHPFKISLIAHSLGNRLVARAAPVMHNVGLVSDAELVSPDIDAETFKHYVIGYYQPHGVRVRLYVSYRDKVLPFIQMLYGGYYRLGEGVGSVMAAISAPQKTMAQTRAQKSGRRGKILAARRILLEGKPLEKIDFTAVDKGLIGHEFPFSLVAHMIKNDTPGPGLALVPEKAGQGNVFARFAHWWCELPPPEENKPGYCQRVVKEKMKPATQPGR